MTKELEQIMANAGFFQAGETTTDQIHFGEEIRTLCENNVCRHYNTTWACPPATGTVEECKARCLSYRFALVFSQKYCLEDSFDLEGMLAGQKDFHGIVRKLSGAIGGVLNDYLLMGSEGCEACDKCTYPDSPCRFPEKMHPSVEAYGIYVNELTRAAGINYINGPDTVTYIGALLYNG